MADTLATWRALQSHSYIKHKKCKAHFTPFPKDKSQLSAYSTYFLSFNLFKFDLKANCSDWGTGFLNDRIHITFFFDDKHLQTCQLS